jgi:hypothetical protein
MCYGRHLIHHTLSAFQRATSCEAVADSENLCPDCGGVGADGTGHNSEGNGPSHEKRVRPYTPADEICVGEGGCRDDIHLGIVGRRAGGLR